MNIHMCVGIRLDTSVSSTQEAIGIIGGRVRNDVGLRTLDINNFYNATPHTMIGNGVSELLTQTKSYADQFLKYDLLFKDKKCRAGLKLRVGVSDSKLDKRIQSEKIGKGLYIRKHAEYCDSVEREALNEVDKRSQLVLRLVVNRKYKSVKPSLQYTWPKVGGNNATRWRFWQRNKYIADDKGEVIMLSYSLDMFAHLAMLLCTHSCIQVGGRVFIQVQGVP